MPTLRSSRFLRAPENAEPISAAPPTSDTTMKPTNAGVIPNATAACCTDSTNTSLTSATSTVTPASVAKAKPHGHGASPVFARVCATEERPMGFEREYQAQSIGGDQQHRQPHTQLLRKRRHYRGVGF